MSIVHDLGIDKMSREERIALVHEIWETIDAEPPPPLSDELQAELRRRVAEYKAHPEDAIPWEETEAKAIPLLTDAQRAELDRRAAEYEANPNNVVPWEQVLAQAIARRKP